MSNPYTNGLTPFTRISTPDNNQTLVASKPSQLAVVAAANISGSPVFLKFFDTAQAGTSAAGFTPQVPIWSMIVPGNSAGAGSNLNFTSNLPEPGGLQFQNGIAIMITQNIALTDNSGIGANSAIVSLAYR